MSDADEVRRLKASIENDWKPWLAAVFDDNELLRGALRNVHKKLTDMASHEWEEVTYEAKRYIETVIDITSGRPPASRPISDLEAIVRALAAGDATDRISCRCRLCGGYTDRRSGHKPSCPWQQAAEWVAAHPATEGSKP